MAQSVTRQMELYLEAMGETALERQVRSAQLTCSQCGGKEGRHHQLCRSQARMKQAREA